MCYNTVIVTVFLAHFMSEANALRISMESNDDATEDVKSPRIVIWKQPHSGGTWIADMLKQEPTMKCFHHDLKCDSLKKWVKAPPCNCGCSSKSNSTECLMGENGKPLGIGFSKNPDDLVDHMSKKKVGAINLASDSVIPVHLVRTNSIRHALSYARVRRLEEKCGSKTASKHRGNKTSYKKCVQNFPQKIMVHPALFVAKAQQLSYLQRERHEGLVSELQKENKEGRLLTISYENLMKDAPGEMTHLLRYVGLLGPNEFAQAEAQEITNTSLQEEISNFGELEMELQRNGLTCLTKQLYMKDHEHFQTWTALHGWC
eukprot:gnl/MRDRNA2_/MRDRNA2_61600_c0_seq1.p1 gnl/MRDRNA2_/MRDRNA2_61600_c0~~gnl/MRDRNA2_/MRDRNA2_61600_c0_seq1.p1  ORF type:complete len:317 (+),score=57.55 gnl/MRDRNA2_/MRDRNA2_61600_c0_seq1:103-1053(+)